MTLLTHSNSPTLKTTSSFSNGLGNDRPAPSQQSEQSTWKVKLLYDGLCPLCLHEVNFLHKRDAGRGLVLFVDIADDRYAPEENGGVSFEAAMGRLHAVLPDGQVIQSVEVLRRVYETLGMGWVYAATRWPIMGPIADKIYQLWADWRLVLTGRSDLDTLVAERQKRLACNRSERCR